MEGIVETMKDLEKVGAGDGVGDEVAGRKGWPTTN
jgi:hypothetical protein